jgi:hypothetical protein
LGEGDVISLDVYVLIHVYKGTSHVGSTKTAQTEAMKKKKRRKKKQKPVTSIRDGEEKKYIYK